MRTFSLIMDRLFRFFQRLIVTPFLFGWLILWLLLGAAFSTLVATPFIFAFFRENPGESAWHWVIFGPFMLIGVVLAYRDWLERSGAENFFGGFGRDSHGSARFAGKKELRTLEQADGLLIGRNPRTGKLLRYDGPAHLLTLAPTRAGKGVVVHGEVADAKVFIQSHPISIVPLFSSVKFHFTSVSTSL